MLWGLSFLHVGLREHTTAHSITFNYFSTTIQLLLSTHAVLADLLHCVCTVAGLVV